MVGGSWGCGRWVWLCCQPNKRYVIAGCTIANQIQIYKSFDVPLPTVPDCSQVNIVQPEGLRERWRPFGCGTVTVMLYLCPTKCKVVRVHYKTITFIHTTLQMSLHYWQRREKLRRHPRRRKRENTKRRN